MFVHVVCFIRSRESGCLTLCKDSATNWTTQEWVDPSLARRLDFSLLQIGQDMKLTTHLYLELRVRMSKAVHPFTHMPSSNTQT